MALLEQEAIRFAESLDDYEHVTVKDIGGWGTIGYWLVVHDHRLKSTTRSHRIATTGTSSRALVEPTTGGCRGHS
jgi:hypothetical protein